MAFAWRNLSDAILEHASRRGDAPALLRRAGPVSYAALGGLITRAAVHLHGLGIAPGEVVAVALPAGVDRVVMLFALLRVGAVPIDLPDGPGLAAALAALRTGRVLLPAGAAVPEGATAHHVDAAWQAAMATHGGDRRVARDGAAVALLHAGMARAGGMKATQVTHAQMLARMDAVVALLPEVMTPARMPLLVQAGETGFAALLLLVTQLALGGAVLLAAPGPLARILAEAGDAVCLIGAAQARALAAGAGNTFGGLRALLVGAGGLSPAEKPAVARLAGQVFEVFGHAAGGLLAGHRLSAETGEGIGRPVPGVWAEIVDNAGRRAAPGSVGILRFRGPGVSDGLHLAPPPVAAREGLRDGWLIPGDAASMDAEGVIRLRGRVGDLLRRRGADVFLPALESVLAAAPNVTAAAAVGVPLKSGVQVHAFVSIADSPDLTGLRRHCARELPAFMRPDRLVAMPALPVDAAGKIDRKRLNLLALQAVAAETTASPGTI